MKIRRSVVVAMLAGAAGFVPGAAQAQCCLSGLFAGCQKAQPAYAVAPVAAPIMAPIAAPIPAPPPPVVVPVQQVSYVPETTYRTQYQCVPVTCYKPSTEIDPCTGCPRECMEQVTQYVQQRVNVPVTQYRAVYSTKYVQMQPGYGAAGVPGAAMPMAPAAAASPFASTIQTTPQAWGAAGTDVPQQLIQPAQPQGIAAPAMAPAMVAPQGLQQPVYPQQTYQQPIQPQAGSFTTPSAVPVQPQPTAPPALTPTPALKPIPDLQRSGAAAATQPPSGNTGTAPLQTQPRGQGNALTAPGTGGTGTGASMAPSGGSSIQGNGNTVMPVLPGAGPNGATGAFPKLLEPTGHTTSWKPVAVPPQSGFMRDAAYPTASLPGRVQ